MSLVSDASVDEIGLNPGAIHALWTLHGLGTLDGSRPDATKAAVGALRHKSAGVRRTALQVLPANGESVRALIESGVATFVRRRKGSDIAAACGQLALHGEKLRKLKIYES